MVTRHLGHKLLTFSIILSLLFSICAPIAHAQDGDKVYFPTISGGTAPARADEVLFRTTVTVSTSVQWRGLERMAVEVLDRGDDWALLLVDDRQLADLARLRYNPVETIGFGLLTAANASRNQQVANSLQTLLDTADAVQQAVAANTSAAEVRAELHAVMASLSGTEFAFIAQADTVDTDGDGLTDTQEVWWCTNPNNANSDSLSGSDGAEVTALKNWMNNKTSTFPSTGKPFAGWPSPSSTTCPDGDQDSVPDIAEELDLGLNPSRESTDRDKFDDGQELFGLTFCTGQGGFCSYGPLPRNEDWGVIFAEMPSWVKAPGNHPLVAAFPEPEIDLVQSSLHVATVSVATTDHTIASGTEKSYSTAKTEGTSSSVADSQTWNDWQETATTIPSFVLAASLDQRSVNIDFKGIKETTNETIEAACFVDPPPSGVEVVDFGIQLACFGHDVGELINEGIYYGALYGPAISHSISETADKIQVATKQNLRQLQQGALDVYSFAKDIVTKFRNTEQTQDRSTSNAGHSLSLEQDAQLSTQPVIDIGYLLNRPTVTTTNGNSWGGSHTTTHTQYEEQTVTNGEAFSNEESWGDATAVDSIHAADMWFSYKVRNNGTEYARQIANLAFNIYIGDDKNPMCTYFLATNTCGQPGSAVLFQNFMPGQEQIFTSGHIPLTLEQMKAIDLGGPIRIVVEDFSYGIDELFYQDAANSGVLVALEDGADDGDELIDNYLIPTWGEENVLQVLARYFPHETDTNGTLTAIWTPEYQSTTPTWCREPRRPTDQPTKAVWCKHELSTADWWNVYTDGLGDGSEGFQDTQAVPGAVALFRFNKDSDLDGFSDRSETRLGTDAKDASSFPRPELLAGLHNDQSGNNVVATLSLLNTGIYDAYGVEAVMVAPDDSISITNNTVGGSGRVRAQQQVIVGSRILLHSPLPTPWTQANHATPGADGYYTGFDDRTYTFTVSCANPGGCSVGSDTWTLNWSDGKGNSGSLPFGSGYASPTFVAVGTLGVTVALYSGNVQNGENFTVDALTPRDTFQYTINREPHSAPLIIVSYNDPQGNHRFLLPPASMDLDAPTDNLQVYARQMLEDVGIELVTTAPFAPGNNSTTLLVNNPSDQALTDAHLFFEFINISGTVVSEVPIPVTVPVGPSYVSVNFSSNGFSPAYDPQQDYIVLAFLTDYQGNILDTAGRPLSSFQIDPLPTLAVDLAQLTWNFGSVPQGALLKHPLQLGNTGFGRLYTYLESTPGLVLVSDADTVGAADTSGHELTLRTSELAVGAIDQTLTIHTSDLSQPTVSLHVLGTITAPAVSTAGGLVRPLDVAVTVQGPKYQGDWVEFSHDLGPDPATLHPVKVYPADYSTLLGVGKYAADFAQGTTLYDMLGDGRDGDIVISSNTTFTPIDASCSGSAGSQTLYANQSSFAVGQKILIHQSSGDTVGVWEINDIAGYDNGVITLKRPLQHNYVDGGAAQAQVLVLKQYRNMTINSGTVLTGKQWNGNTGGILAFLVSGTLTNNGSITVSGLGYNLGGLGRQGNLSPSFTQTGEGNIGYRTDGNTDAYGSGGGHGTDNEHHTGGGGGNQANGGIGQGQHGSDGHIEYSGGAGGLAISPADFDLLLFGGEGGGGSSSYGAIGGAGGAGGGILLISGDAIVNQGYIESNGGVGANGNFTNGWGQAGGGGAGGSMLFRARSMNLGASIISARGGNGGIGANEAGRTPPLGGTGSIGRIKVEHCEDVTGTTNPDANAQKLECHIVEQVESSPYLTGRLNLSEEVTTSATYRVPYGRKLDYGAGGEQTTTLRVPSGIASSVTLDALVSGVGTGSVTFKLDVGNDGTWDWETTQDVTEAATLSSANLFAAFNTYWQNNGAPASGNLDIPIKVSLSKAGQVLLTNLQVNSAGSKPRSVRLPARNYGTFNLDFTVGSSGPGPFTVALDIGDDGSIDWSDSRNENLPIRLTTGNLASAVNTYLTGQSGDVDVPIRIYVSPDAPVILNDYTTTFAAVTDLIASGMQAQAPMVQVSAVGSVVVHEGDSVPMQATAGNGGNVDSGPMTAAFFATAPGWGDWYIGSDFTSNIAAGGSWTPSVEWDTTGFVGTIPVKVVVNPYKRVNETNYTNNSSSTNVTVLLPPPTASFTSTATSSEPGLTVRFTDTSTANAPIIAWSWNFGDSGISSQQHPVHIYNSTGSFTVTLTVTDTNGLADTQVAYILIDYEHVAPWADFAALPSGGPAPLTVHFTDMTDSPHPLTGWQWDFGDGQNSTEQHPTHEYQATGIYTTTLTVANAYGNDSHSTQIVVGPEQVTIQIPLVAGWNLISIPVQPANSAPAQVFASIADSYTVVWAYKGCDSADPWKKYSPTGAAFANDLQSIDVTLGLWIFATTNTTLSVTGTEPTSTAIPLCTDWNLVGYPGQIQASADALTSITGCYDIVWGYNAADTADPWKKYNPTGSAFANDLTQLHPAFGYWVLANQSCSWTVNDAP